MAFLSQRYQCDARIARIDRLLDYFRDERL